VALPSALVHARSVPGPGGALGAVLVHGLGGSSLNWTDLLLEIGPEVGAVAPDLPGFGASDPPVDGDYRPAAMAEVVAELIEARCEPPVHLIGNSMGGAIALVVAARRPDLVRSLALVSPALPRYTAMLTNIHLPVLTVPKVGEAVLDRYLARQPALRMQATIEACFADPARLHPQRLAEALAETAARDALPYARDAYLQSLRGLLATYRDASDQRPWRLAEQVRCPVLVLHGRADRLVDPRGADRASRHFGNVRVVVLPDTGHVAMQEHPARVAAHWRAFVAEMVDRPGQS
jgi:pimeloyl-ACP methyl ester carboxylesterase